MQDQKIGYDSLSEIVENNGWGFIIQSPSQAVLCAMKFASVINRQKASDFYDIPFLLSKDSKPDIPFLNKRLGIHSLSTLRSTVLDMVSKINYESKIEWIDRLLINKSNSERIRSFSSHIAKL